MGGYKRCQFLLSFFWGSSGNLVAVFWDEIEFAAVEENSEPVVFEASESPCWFLRHRFSPKSKSVATQNSLPKRNHVAKEAVSAARQTKTRQRSERRRKPNDAPRTKPRPCVKTMLHDRRTTVRAAKLRMIPVIVSSVPVRCDETIIRLSSLSDQAPASNSLWAVGSRAIPFDNSSGPSCECH